MLTKRNVLANRSHFTVTPQCISIMLVKALWKRHCINIVIIKLFEKFVRYITEIQKKIKKLKKKKKSYLIFSQNFDEILSIFSRNTHS